MSNPVRVSVKCCQNVTVCNKDEIKVNLGKDPIFSDPRAEEIVEDVMNKHNFEKKNNKTEYIKTEENTVVIWDTSENSISIKADEKKVITVEGEKTKAGDSYFSGVTRDILKEKLEKKARQELQEELKQKAEEKKLEIDKKQKDKLVTTLEDKLSGVLEETREIVSEIYKNWVKKRAETLGNITSEKISTSEDGSIFEMTIEIKDNS